MKKSQGTDKRWSKNCYTLFGLSLLIEVPDEKKSFFPITVHKVKTETGFTVVSFINFQYQISFRHFNKKQSSAASKWRYTTEQMWKKQGFSIGTEWEWRKKDAPAGKCGAEPVQCPTNKGQNTGSSVGS